MASASPAQAETAKRRPSLRIRLIRRRGMAGSFLVGMIRPGLVRGTVALPEELERCRFDAMGIEHCRGPALYRVTNPILPHDFPCRRDLEYSSGVRFGHQYITIQQR